MELCKKVKYLFMDVDGTLTDGKIYMGNMGEEFKAFNIKDGYAIHDLLPIASITPIIITGRKSAIVENRCNELGIKHIFQGICCKKEFLQKFFTDLGADDIVAYIGDDLNDIEAMHFIKERGGIIGCPSDSVKGVLEVADFISTKRGGDGAVRDFAEWIMGGDVI